MGRMINMLMLVFIIEFCLVVFLGATYPGSSLYIFLTEPQDWDDNVFLGQIINDVLLLLGGAAIIAGLYFIRNEWIIYAGISVVFLSFGTTLYNAWQTISSQAMFGDSGSFIATIFVGVLFIMFVIITIDFARGRD